MEKPLIVSLVQTLDATKALQDIDCEVLSVPSLNRMLKAEFPRAPRLFLIQSLPSETGPTLQAVQSLRRQCPLTEVLIWSPQATGAAVRELFQAGAKDVIVSRSVAKLVETVQTTLEEQQFLPKLEQLSRRRSRGSRFESMLSRSAAMWDLFELCTRIAPTEATVLIVGETGTGKELLARAVHRQSERKGRFVAANCANASPELINSQLFGHEKGAFTGADRSKKGLVTHANDGTLFLDEIGDMPAEAQQSLLRMLQEKRIRPVGSLTETDVDVRVIAATNVPLDQAIGDGTFREDLFYRLDVIRMNIPPLRERHEDILFLFGHFSKRLAKHYGLEPPTFADSFLDAMLEFDWPGNVRQLENLSERLVLARPQRALTQRDFAKLQSATSTDSKTNEVRASRQRARRNVDTSKTMQDNLEPVIEQLEREYVVHALEENAGRIAETAQQAGISRAHVAAKDEPIWH